MLSYGSHIPAPDMQLKHVPCRHRWLCNEALPPTSRRWAIEGLAYLTFDADVKEDLVEDKNALQAMFQLAKVLHNFGFLTRALWFKVSQTNLYVKCFWECSFKDLACVCIFSAQTLTENCLSLQSEDKTVLFAVGSTLVNCTNSYDVEKPDAQMVELAKYAKQHVPEEHPKVQHSNY